MNFKHSFPISMLGFWSPSFAHPSSSSSTKTTHTQSSGISAVFPATFVSEGLEWKLTARGSAVCLCWSSASPEFGLPIFTKVFFKKLCKYLFWSLPIRFDYFADNALFFVIFFGLLLAKFCFFIWVLLFVCVRIRIVLD